MGASIWPWPQPLRSLGLLWLGDMGGVIAESCLQDSELLGNRHGRLRPLVCGDGRHQVRCAVRILRPNVPDQPAQTALAANLLDPDCAQILCVSIDQLRRGVEASESPAA